MKCNFIFLEVNCYYHVDLLCDHLCSHHYFPNARRFIANQQTYFIFGNPTTGVCLALFRYTNAISYRRVGCKQKAKTLCLVKSEFNNISFIYFKI